VNVHTADYPAGEIRGQIGAIKPPFKKRGKGPPRWVPPIARGRGDDDDGGPPEDFPGRGRGPDRDDDDDDDDD